MALDRSRSSRHRKSTRRRTRRGAPSGLQGLGPAPLAAPKSTAAKCKICCRKFIAFLFSHVGLCALVVGYTIGGAFMFQAIEAPAEVQMASQVNEMRNLTLRRLWNVTQQYNVLYKGNWSRKVLEQVREFQHQLVDKIKEGYDIKSTGEQWSFSGAFLYSLTVITTIGYGNIAPRTETGKIITIVYAIFGIPLMLLYLTNIGDILAKSFRYVYGHLCVCKPPEPPPVPVPARKSTIRRPALNPQQAAQRQSSLTTQPSRGQHLSTPPVGHELQRSRSSPSANVAASAALSQDTTENGVEASQRTLPLRPGARVNLAPNLTEIRDVASSAAASVRPRIRKTAYDDKVHVPITLSLTILITYVMAGGLLFSEWEDWPYLDGAYFCFITLSTIGFGDLVPGDSISGSDSESQEKLVICSLYLLAGLALLSMCFNLMQEEVIHKVKMCCMRVGLLGTNSEEEDDEDEEDMDYYGQDMEHQV